MKHWLKPGLMVAAVALAVVAATGAYAMGAGGHGAEPRPSAGASTPTATASESARSFPTPMPCACAELPAAPELTCEEADACGGEAIPSCGFTDPRDDIGCPCSVDTPGSSVSRPLVPCAPATCPPNADCAEPQPGIVLPTPVCAQEMPIAACYPDARPAGPFVCEPAVRPSMAPVCHPPDCVPQLKPPPPSELCVRPSPLPPCAVTERVCGCAQPMPDGEVGPDATTICHPPDCSPRPRLAPSPAWCLPPSPPLPCAVPEHVCGCVQPMRGDTVRPDATSSCYPPDCVPQVAPLPSSGLCMQPSPGQPCALTAGGCGCGPVMEGDSISPCAPPPDCSISSDGVIACPPPPAGECAVGAACSSPGSPPTR